MRVTVVGHEVRGFVPVGGMGTATAFLALALARMGHSVEILVGSNAPSEMDPYWAAVYKDAGIGIRAAPASVEPVEPWQFEGPRSTELGLRADPPDVVIAPDFGAPAYTALRLREAGVAFADTLFVVFCHGPRRYVMEMSDNVAFNDLEPLLGVSVLERLAVELADVVVSPSAFMFRWMREQGWRLPERHHVIPYFTRSSVIGEPSTHVAPTGSSVRTLAFFGRLDDKKGLKPLTAALNALEPELLDGIELEFLGKPTSSWPVERVDSLFSEATKRALRRISFETNLDQHAALERLSRPGTLAVMPTLYDNSPNTVYECLEHGIPFIASAVGGIPELIASEDHARVLFEPTAEGVEAALRRSLSGELDLRPARPSFTSATPFERWAEVIEMRPPRPAAADDAAVDVVVHRRSPAARSRCVSALEHQTYGNVRVIVAEGTSVEAARQNGLRAGSNPYVLFLDEDDAPDDELVATLVRARAASGADAATCGVRIADEGRETTLHFFAGEPGGLGVLSNAYGTVALYRRASIDDVTSAWFAEADPEWPLLARLAASGARIVSVPVPLVTRATRPGSLGRNPSDALLALRELERALPGSARSAARLAAGLAADTPAASDGRSRSPFRRAWGIVRAEGPGELARRARGRLFHDAR